MRTVQYVREVMRPVSVHRMLARALVNVCVCEHVATATCAGQSTLKWHNCNVKRQLLCALSQSLSPSHSQPTHSLSLTHTLAPILIEFGSFIYHNT